VAERLHLSISLEMFETPRKCSDDRWGFSQELPSPVTKNNYLVYAAGCTLPMYAGDLANECEWDKRGVQARLTYIMDVSQSPRKGFVEPTNQRTNIPCDAYISMARCANNDVSH
jgi:hypothetical protein